MFFKSYGVNPSVDTEDDHLSTFALDVDTGSYTVARGYITDGHLPPEDAVRVEEFVNYFDQDYAYPAEGQAFAIHVDAAPFPFAETERYRMMRVGIQGYAVPPEERKDVSLTFVIDVSGSMGRANRLGLVKRSLQLLVEQLRPTDSVSIVVYGTDARVVLEPTSGADRDAILGAIYALRSEGSTNADAGLTLGYERANSAFRPGGINRVILCSDGVANVGRTGPESILEIIKGYASEGITLTTVGFGMGNYNDVLMEQLADKGDGFYAYVDTLQEAKRLFVQNLTSTLQAIAIDAKVQVDFNPEVVARYRLVGFENRAIADEQFRDDSVEAGAMGAGHKVTALYEIKLHPETDGRVATIYLRWEDPEAHEVVEINQDFDSGDMAESFSAASPRFQLDVVVAEYAEILRSSYWAEGSTLSAVLEEAEAVSRLLPDDPDVAEFADLVRQASAMANR
jgi:Ca-activated chloride channel family protein